MRSNITRQPVSAARQVVATAEQQEILPFSLCIPFCGCSANSPLSAFPNETCALLKFPEWHHNFVVYQCAS